MQRLLVQLRRTQKAGRAAGAAGALYIWLPPLRISEANPVFLKKLAVAKTFLFKLAMLRVVPHIPNAKVFSIILPDFVSIENPYHGGQQLQRTYNHRS
ncbi:hypothetical protein [Compostibacter hankyongensis]|uniref:hypothetical protein n=1 Tax=Compostibacter hankyongensis TaxID=1007089 RepID=UPI0031EA85F6